MTVAVCLCLGASIASAGRTGSIRRVNLKPDGAETKRPSGFGAVSANGRFVVYLSDAKGLVPGDTNGVSDVFVYDRSTGATERVSVSSDGSQMIGPWGEENTHLDISGDGRFVVFSTVSPGLVPDDTNGYNDIFLHDRDTGKTVRASVNSLGEQGDGESFEPTISANGRFIGFQSVAENLSDVSLPDEQVPVIRSYVHDRKAKTTTLVGLSSESRVANNHTTALSLSSDGRYAAFESGATNLDPDDRGRRQDVFVRDLVLGRTKYISKSSREEHGNDASFEPTISGDGRFVAFASFASNLVRGDRQDLIDIFVRDRMKGVTKRVSVSSSGREANDLSFSPEIARAAPVVAFVSRSTTFDGGGTSTDDVYRHNWRTKKTRLVSSAIGGGEANDHSIRPNVSGDGRIITFTSLASDLVRGDRNKVSDQFVWKRAKAG